jgi:hypothetical protein
MKDKPREIRWVIYCLLVLIVMNVISLLIMFGQIEMVAQALIQGLQKSSPALSGDTIKMVVSDILVNRNMFHLFIIVCWTALTYAVYRGKSWARVLLVLFTLLSFLGTLYLFSTTTFVSLQILAVLGWVGRIVLLWLLLIPRPTREYFRISRMVDGSRI